MRLRWLNITQKYTLFLLAISVVPLFLIGLASFEVSQKVIRDEANRYAAELLNSQARYLDLELEQIETLIANLLSVETITNSLSQRGRDGDTYTNLATQAQIGYILNGYSNLRGLVSIDLFTPDGEHYHVGDTLNAHDIRLEMIQHLFNNLSSSDNQVTWLGIEENVNINSSYNQVLTAAKLITARSTQPNVEIPIGVILVNYNIDSLYDQFNQIRLDRDAYQIVVDAQKRVIFHPDRSLIGRTLSSDLIEHLPASAGSLTMRVDSQEMFITYTRLERNGWLIINLIPENTLRGKSMAIGLVTLLCFCGCLVLIGFLSSGFSNQVVEPIKKIIHQFKLFQSGSQQWTGTLPVMSNDEIGELVRWFNLFSDSLKARRAAEDQLRHEAFYDLLTNLPNRTLFMERLSQAILRSQRYAHERYAVLFMDIDAFKIINDSLGHSVGDELLKEVALRLLSCVRTSDTVARLGGDEFVILLNGIEGTESATIVADRILEAISEPVELTDHRVVISTSIGILFSDESYDSPVAVLRDADTAMYAAKNLGKARYEIFNASMREMIVNRLGLETDLRRAIENREIEIYYMPIFTLAGEQVVSFEALMRWNHPNLGQVPPSSFIPIAEETGLIQNLGEWVLQEACRQVAGWQEELNCTPPLNVNVNISRRQFMNNDLVTHITNILQETGLRASCLHLEITESVIMQDTRITTLIIEQFKQLGVRVEMDDFGTGYSSLNHLTRFKFDLLKIDRSFIAEMLIDEQPSHLVKAIINMAQSLGMKVVAEGIETKEQFTRLREFGCEYGQGYYFSMAMPGSAVREFLLRQNPIRQASLRFDNVE